MVEVVEIDLGGVEGGVRRGAKLSQKIWAGQLDRVRFGEDAVGRTGVNDEAQPVGVLLDREDSVDNLDGKQIMPRSRRRTTSCV